MASQKIWDAIPFITAKKEAAHNRLPPENEESVYYYLYV